MLGVDWGIEELELLLLLGEPPVLGSPPNLMVRKFKKFYSWDQLELSTPPPRGEFFEWIPNQELGGRGPPLKNHPQTWSGVLWGSLFWNHPTNPHVLGIPTISILGEGFLTIKLSKTKNVKLPKKGLRQRLSRKRHISSRSLSQERKKEKKKKISLILSFEVPTPFSRKLRTIHWSRYRDLRVLRDCAAECQFIYVKKTKEVESRSTLKERKIRHLVKEINQTQEKSIHANQWGNRERSRLVTKAWRRFYRMGTLFLIFFTLVSI